MSLPSGYKRLEYIQSTGAQYIDTGFNPNQDTGITIDFQLTSVSSWQCIVGAANNSSNADSYSIWHSGTYFAFYYASSNKQWSGLGNSERHVISASKNTAVADNQNSITLTYSNFKTNYPLILFAPNYAGSKTYPASMKLYSCQIYDNGTLVRDFIPCQKPNGTIGLWDDVNSVFYGNAGNGSFIAGPVMEPPASPEDFRQTIGVRLAWSSVSGADSYNVYRDGVLLGSTIETVFVDDTAAENQEYIYGVSSVSQGGESPKTTITVYTKTGYFLYKPYIESATFQ